MYSLGNCHVAGNILPAAGEGDEGAQLWEEGEEDGVELPANQVLSQITCEILKQ